MSYDPYYHHRRSLRLKGYDYSSEGYYFVTMCSLNRKKIFADIFVGPGLAPALQYESTVLSLSQTKTSSQLSSFPSYFPPVLKLTRIGEIIDKQWKEIPYNYKNVIIDEYVIMPDHFHGIIVIKNDQNSNRNPDSDSEAITGNYDLLGLNPSPQRAPARGAPTRKERSFNKDPETLGSIIGSFKSLCVTENLKYIKLNSLHELGKIWQRDYFEHIIRDKNELYRIRKYIKSNPYNWLKDRLISSNKYSG